MYVYMGQPVAPHDNDLTSSAKDLDLSLLASSMPQLVGEISVSPHLQDLDLSSLARSRSHLVGEI